MNNDIQFRYVYEVLVSRVYIEDVLQVFFYMIPWLNQKTCFIALKSLNKEELKKQWNDGLKDYTS